MFGFDDKLKKYAEVIVKVGLNLQDNQELIITAPIGAVQLVDLVTEQAYKAGSKLVTTFYINEKDIVNRLIHGTENTLDYAPDWLNIGIETAYKNGAARLAILGNNPELLKGYDTSKIGRISKASAKSRRGLMKLVTSSHSQWSIASFVTKEWAKSVYPTSQVDDAIDNLWNMVFNACRISNEDPIAEWKTHNEKLHTRTDTLNKKNFKELHFVGPDTDLIVGLADGHIWCGGSKEGGTDVGFNANIPTEEVFTTPHRLNVNGFVSATKPLLFRGQKISGIKAEFKDGKIVNFSTDEGFESFKQLIETDEGAARIGEVALVPYSSPISLSGVLYNETLYDENAACHIAQGQSYSTCMVSGTEEQLFEYGANKSNVHVDWMIGSNNISVIGIHHDGTKEDIMIDGEFVGDF